MNRKKKVVLNFAADFFPQVFIALIGIFKTKIFLNYWNNNLVGLYQLYSQLFSYISIIEIGISSVVLYRLYAPFVKKDYDKISGIYNGSNFIFRIIVSIIIILGIILSFFIGFFIKDNNFNFHFLQVTFILYVISNIFNYYTMSKRLIFFANEKNYIVNIVQQGLTIIKGILEIFLVIKGYDLIIVICLAIVINLIINIIISIIYKKQYDDIIKSKNKSFEFMSDLKYMVIHKLSNLISNNIDVVMVSMFIGLDSVIIYTSYQYIIISLQSFTDKISNSFLSSLGLMLKEDKSCGIRLFDRFNDIVFFAAILICIPLYFSINYFIEIWYNGIITTTSILSILFSTLLFMNIIKQIFYLFVNALGLFNETIKCSITDMILNLTLSLFFVNIYGIPGVLIATIISMIITEFIMKSRIILKELGTNLFYYLRKIVCFIVILIINVTSIYIITNILKLLQFNNLLYWFISSIIIFVINLVLLIIEYSMFNRLNSLLVVLPKKWQRKSIINKLKKSVNR